MVLVNKTRGVPGGDHLDVGFFLQKNTLPAEEVPFLLEILEAEGVDATRMFPGYDGAARAVFEEQYKPNRWTKNQVL